VVVVLPRRSAACVGSADGSRFLGREEACLCPLPGYSVPSLQPTGRSLMAKELGEWAINYLPEEGGRYTGKLTVTDEKLSFVSLYESSNKTIVKAIFLDVSSFAAAGGHTVYRYSNDNEARVELPVGEIAGVEARKKGLMKQAAVTMKDGQEFVFDYGLLSVKKLVETIDSVIPR
jgi:hypothetical protein